MKKHFRIYVYGLIAVLLMSTVGVTIYKHTCKHDGIFYSVFFDIEHNCESDKTIVKTDCHQNNNKHNNESLHNNCCVEDISFFQIESDLAIHHINSIDFDFVVSCIFPNRDFSLFETCFSSFNTDKDRPPAVLETIERLAQLQIFVI